LSVIGPPPDHSAAGGASSSSSVFRSLQEQAKQASEEDLNGENVYEVVKWRNGFTINDGELLDSESVEGLNFFKRLSNNQIPREIEELEIAKGSVHGPFGATVKIVDKQGEDFIKKVDSKSLFKKEGATIGKRDACADDHCLRFTEATTAAALAGPAPAHDPAQTSTMLAVKGTDGKTTKFKINTSVTVDKLGAVLVQQLGLAHGGEAGFTISAGFPPKCIETAKASKTLQELGLNNTSIAQIMR